MDKKNLIMGGAAAIIFLVAIIYYVSRPGAEAPLPSAVKANCACLACRQAVFVKASLSDLQPYKCPECGERAVYPVLVCRDCGKLFVPNLERRGGGEVEGIEEENLPQVPIVPSCISCGSTNVGSYLGDEEIPSEDLLLPDWPQ